MKVKLIFLGCLFSLNVHAREYERIERNCKIRGFQEDIDTKRFELPHEVHLKFSFTYTKDTHEVVRQDFSIAPDAKSQIPLSPALKDSLLFSMKKITAYTNYPFTIHFSSILSREDIVNLIQHLASNKTLETQDPLVIPERLEFRGGLISGFTQFLYPKGYFFDFVSGLAFQAHLPLQVKNGLSYHVQVESCDDMAASVFSLARPNSTEILVSARGNTCDNSIYWAEQKCKSNAYSMIVYQLHNYTDVKVGEYCDSVIMCQ